MKLTKDMFDFEKYEYGPGWLEHAQPGAEIMNVDTGAWQVANKYAGDSYNLWRTLKTPPRYILLNEWDPLKPGDELLEQGHTSFNEVDEIRMPARWSEGLTAGPERNRRMLKFAKELAVPGERLVLVAFPGGYGTASCVREAKWLDIEVKEIQE